MHVRDFGEPLIEEKRKKFFKCVYLACTARELPLPDLNFEGCPDEDSNQLAHYHPHSNRICVSKRQLEKLNFDDIEDTATHEAAHILEHNHGPGFHEEHQIIKIGAWTPPPGTTLITGTKRRLPKRMPRSKKDFNTACNANLCKIKENLHHCDYCAVPFCPEHFIAKLPKIPPFKERGPKASVLMEEWRQPGGHPCPARYDAHKEERARDSARYKSALDKLCSTPSRLLRSKPKGSKHNYQPSSRTPLIPINWKRIGIVAAIIMAIILFNILRQHVL